MQRCGEPVRAASLAADCDTCPPSRPQISAITPFQIVSACVFGMTVYGMAGLRPGAEAVLKSAFINTVMYLIASQVGEPRGGCFD
jgi:hypothetical protein